MKGGPGGTAVSGWFSQRVENLVEFNNRARPAVGNNDRHGIVMTAPYMQEMNVEILYLSFELTVSIEAVLGPVPVIVVGPVIAEFTVVIERHSLGPVFDSLGVGPAG